MLTLITATGARPEAWELCQHWMALQTYEGPVRWVIVDDGPQPQKIGFRRKGWYLEIVRPPELWTGGNTQARNLLLALNRARDKVVVVEDDDAYLPGYLADMDVALNDADLVGLSPSRYFNVRTGKGKVMANLEHASLCSTGMKGEALNVFREVLETCTRLIDVELWKRAKARGVSAQLLDLPTCVGIKGLPGRAGIGIGHRDNFGLPMNLRDWIGDAARYYGL